MGKALETEEERRKRRAEQRRQRDQNARVKSVSTIADQFGLSKSAIYKYVKQGVISAYRCGAAIRLDPQEVEQALREESERRRLSATEANTVAPSEPAA